MADICAAVFQSFPLSTYAPAASFCASYSCTDLTSTHISTATFTNLVTSTTAPVAIVTAVTTVVNNITESSTATSTLSLTSVVGTTTVTATLTPVSPAAVLTTVTVTTTVTPLAKRDVCTVHPPKCSTFVSTEFIPRLVTRTSSTERLATVQPAISSSVSEQVSKLPPYYPAQPSTTPYHGPAEKSSKSVCSKRTKSSKKTMSGSTTCTSQYAASGASGVVSVRLPSASASSGTVSARLPAASASGSISSRVSSSVDPLITLLSSLQGLPSSAISTACACLEGYECRTTHVVTTTTITLSQTVIATAPVTTTFTATATNQLTTTITAVVTTTLTISSTATVTTTQILPSFTPTTITLTTTTTTTAAPQQSTACTKVFTVSDGKRINNGYIVAVEDFDTVSACEDACGALAKCDGFNFEAEHSYCALFGVSPRVRNEQPGIDHASKYTFATDAGYVTGIWTSSNCSTTTTTAMATTTTAAPQPTEVCGSGKSFTVYAGRTIEGQFIFASGAGSSIDFCATTCGGYTRCEGFDFNAGTNVCRYYGTRVKSMPGTLADASTYQTIPNPDYTADIWTSNC